MKVKTKQSALKAVAMRRCSLINYSPRRESIAKGTMMKSHEDNEMQLELFLPEVKCDECGKVTWEPVWVVRHICRSTVQYAFCCQEHANDFYTKRNHAIKIGEGYVPET